MQQGAPSVNATGRAGIATAISAAVTAALEGAAKAKLRAAPGSDGVISYGGWLVDGEKNPKLRGATKWVEQDNLIANMASVAAAVRVWLDLAGSVKWTARENPRGGTDAKRCAELAQEGLIGARMPKPWRRCVLKQVLAEMRGFAFHSKGTRRDSQGRVVYTELRHLPQWTIEKWLKPDEMKPWQGVEQRTRSGRVIPIDRGDLWYSVDDRFGDSPDGVGLFRHLIRIGEIFERYRQLHGIAADTDVNGIPVGRAPIGKLWQQAMRPVSEGGGGLTETSEIAAWVASRVQPLSDLLENRVVKPNRSLLLDSLPYFATDTDGSARPSNVFEWSIDTMKAVISSFPELRATLDDCNLDALRLLCCEWMYMGDGEGARAVHVDKTDGLARRLNGVLDFVGDDGDRDLVWPLVAQNGYDPETCAPTLEHSPIGAKDMKAIAEAFASFAKAKFSATDPINDWFRNLLDAPLLPDDEKQKQEAGAKEDPDEDKEVPDPGEGDKE
jgi:hypothetical protein